MVLGVGVGVRVAVGVAASIRVSIGAGVGLGDGVYVMVDGGGGVGDGVGVTVSPCVKGGEIMCHLGERTMEGGLEVQGGDVSASYQGLLCGRNERSRGCAGIRTASGHGAQDA